MNPKGHAALVTGGASGLGEATAKRLAAAGCKVTMLDMNMDAARDVAQKIGALADHCDVSDEASTMAALKEARDKHGVARILVNCAGIGERGRIVGKEGPMPLAHFEDHQGQPSRHVQRDAAVCRRHADRAATRSRRTRHRRHDGVGGGL